MKTIGVLLLLFAAGPLRAQNQSPSLAGVAEVSVRGADIRQIGLDTQTGKLSFSAQGQQYVLQGHAESAGGFEAVAVAKLGILNEMRRCNSVTMTVVHPDGPAQPGTIVTMVLNYDALKP